MVRLSQVILTAISQIGLLRFSKVERRRRKRLEIRGRPKLPTEEFKDDELLFRGFEVDDLDEHGRIDVEAFESSDISVNWSRFSIAEDVKYRDGAKDTDGCFAFSVHTCRLGEIASPCHDPLSERRENYSHTEVRWLRAGETKEPAKGRPNAKSKAEKARRLAWKTRVVENAAIEIRAT